MSPRSAVPAYFIQTQRHGAVRPVHPRAGAEGGLALPAREDATALLSRRRLPVAPRRVTERASGTACP